MATAVPEPSLECFQLVLLLKELKIAHLAELDPYIFMHKWKKLPTPYVQLEKYLLVNLKSFKRNGFLESG